MSTHTHDCRGCNAHYDGAAWASLVLVERLRPDQVGDIFTEWPWARDATLEVRRCACGSTVTSLHSGATAESHAA
jgi:hypothetical protein